MTSDRDLARPGGEAVADARDLPDVADVLPRPPEDRLLLAVQDLGSKYQFQGSVCSTRQTI